MSEKAKGGGTYGSKEKDYKKRENRKRGQGKGG